MGGGKFPESIIDNLHLSLDGAVRKWADILPCRVLRVGTVTALVAHMFTGVG
jgi:hypothetical protein